MDPTEHPYLFDHALDHRICNTIDEATQNEVWSEEVSWWSMSNDADNHRPAAGDDDGIRAIAVVAMGERDGNGATRVRRAREAKRR